MPREEVIKKVEDLHRKIEALEEELKPSNTKIKKENPRSMVRYRGNDPLLFDN